MRTMIGVLTGAIVLLGSVAVSAETIEFEDPKGDDKGPGKYVYPTDAVYAKGSFDLTKVELKDKGSTVEVTVTVASRIEDPWDSPAWGGNGFSVQMAFVHIDMDHKAGSGHDKSLPGLNVVFADDARWEKVLIISPQGNSRLQSEINLKAKALKKDIVLPKSVKAKGRKLVARYAKKDIGGDLSKSWGYQVLMNSNEGYPTKSDFLTRKVNEYNGKHRFGGGSDYDCDPHVMDLLAGKGKGEASEKDAQYKMLGTYKCDAEGKGNQATITMVYPEG